MSQPIVYVDTSEVRPGRLEELNRRVRPPGWRAGEHQAAQPRPQYARGRTARTHEARLSSRPRDHSGFDLSFELATRVGAHARTRPPCLLETSDAQGGEGLSDEREVLEDLL